MSQSHTRRTRLLTDCAALPQAPEGFERVWAAFEPMDAMQKRGQIARPQTGEAWQLLCDEGVSLGGTDWAPPPLAYFAAGLASSVAGSVTERLTGQDAAVDDPHAGDGDDLVTG